jgi:hypothetical protein
VGYEIDERSFIPSGGYPGKRAMTALTKMKLIAIPMIIATFVGLKAFLDHYLVLIPILCIVGFILSFALLVKWNVERLRGR